MRPVMYDKLPVIASARKLNPRHARYRLAPTKPIPISIAPKSGCQATATAIPAVGRPVSKRHRPEYHRPTCWRALIRASRLARTSASRENGKRSSAGKSFTAAASDQQTPGASAAARRRSAVQALVARARPHRDGAAVRARGRVGVDERDLLDSARRRRDHLQLLQRVGFGGWSRDRRRRRIATHHARLVLLLDWHEVAGHPPEDVVHDRLRDRDLLVLREP